MTDNLANKISDLKKLADERKQLIVSRTPGATGKMFSSPTRQNTASASASAPLLERPASRLEIHSLELEMEERVRLVLDSSNFVRNPNEFGLEFSYQPHKEAMMLTRERMLNDLNATLQDLEHEPWLDSYVKCECLKQTCDEISSRFADMLGVNSTELGSVARKLRLTYKQSFEQMAVSWKNLRKQFTSNEAELSNLKKQIGVLTRRLENKEEEVSARFDKEIARISREYQEEKERDKAQLAQAELKMDQMSDTLKYLNGIFRAMQNDTASLKTADLHSLVAKLTKENDDLKKENAQFDTIKTQLLNALTKIKTLEGTIRTNNDEIQRLNLQLQRREEAINHLMEKDTIRTAEIEKLQRISKMKDEEILAMDMKDVATSVLCIKCKKSLDDMTNIRSTLMADQAQNPAQKLQCENYRILLPNLRNRKPHRTTPWIRSVIRSILLSKVKEDLSLHFLKGDAMTFPAYTYAWFRRNSDGLTGTALTKLLVQSDEDRWGLYYGVKALHKEDSEASLFWSLLDETFGQDGLRFALYCFSVILSLGGKALWRQFGSAMTHGSSINTKLDDDSSVRANIWIDIATAKEGVAMILTKALAPHLNDALDSIDALKVKPEDLLPTNPTNANANANANTTNTNAENNNQPNEYSMSVRIVPEEPTHISLFTWLRIMLQQFHADQIHRNAAIRLMFETASVGALTPANHNGLDGGNSRGGASGTSGTNSTHVEYPQFQSICQTLFPYLSITEIANLYARCHYAGKRRVTAEVFHYQADIHGFFALSLKLHTLPLLKQLNLEEEIAAIASEEGRNAAGEGISSIIPSTSSAGTVHSMPMVNSAFSSTPSARGGGAKPVMNVDTSDEPHYTKRSLFVIRSKLATVVHRRFAGLMPGVKYLMKYLPERWKATLIDCMELVTSSLNETFNKLKELNKQFQTPPSAQGGRGENTNKAPSSTPSSLDRFLFLDGIQPYLHYRRFLSLVIFLQSCNENPYLPTEIFTAVVIKNNKQNIEKAVLRIEKVIEHLENVIYSPSDLDYVNLPQRIINKYDRFQTTRHVLVIRRIQAVFKKFLSKEVAIPRSVRMVMAAGYLTNSVHQEHLLQPTTEVVEGGLVTSVPGMKKGGFYSAPLKQREVYHEPWWAQVHIANIYLFKISYDMKASQLGKEGISLPQAISAYFYCVWGSMDVAERSIQDLFVAIKAYRFNMPRLRLFSAFVGDGRDLDSDAVEEVFATSEAVSIYYSLLFAIHRQLAKKREYMLRLASKSNGKDHTKMQKSGNSYTIIETLFPSTENTFQRNDKREIWLMDADLLTQAAKAWAGQQSWLKGQVALFSDLPEKLRPDIQNRVDVDDFLWLMMMQWAKLEVFHMKKCLARGSLIEKSIFGSTSAPAVPATPSNNNNPPSSGDPATPQGLQLMKEGFLSRRMSVLPLSNLKSIVESIYRPEDGDDLADIQHYATAFIKSIRSRRAVLPQPIELTSSSAVAVSNETVQRKLNNIRNLDRQFGSELQKLLKDCVLWDTNLAFVESPAQPAGSASDRPTSSAPTREGNSSPTKKRTSAVSKASFLGRTSLFNLAGVTIDENAVNASSMPLVLGEGEKFKPSTSERGSLGGIGAEAMTVHYSAASIKLSHYADNTIIGNGVFSEMMFVMSKAAFSAYQGPINVFLDKLSNDSRFSTDSEVKSRIQAIRLHLLQVGEFFQLHDLSTNHQQTISTKIFNFELLGAVEDLKDTYIERTRYMKLANDSMQKLQSLFSSVSDLAVMTKQEFPRDTWQKGAKIHLERAFVYNIATKNALL